ncbi:hypothetical protein [Pseudonocardia sp. T1-2H]|uniref:hypothetical protein n=1 Tax=Pseudonocardia sp. T1-2H TaxID=3128899 RepID=UPI0031012276
MTVHRVSVAALWRRWRARLDRLDRERIDEQIADLALVRAVLTRAVDSPVLDPVDAVTQATTELAGADPLAVQQALEYTWHVLAGEPDGPVRWNVRSGVHEIHRHDLARRIARAGGGTRRPLRAALERVEADIARLRAERPDG